MYIKRQKQWDPVPVSRKREAAGRRDLQHYFFLPGFADGEVERRDPEGGEKLFHRILGGVDGVDRSGCFRCTPVAVENVHVSVSFLSRLSASGDLRIAWWGRSVAGVDSGDHESSPSICRW